jgi:hypothetical protein
LRAAELFTDHFRESIGDTQRSLAEKNLLADIIYARETFRGLLYRLASLHGRLNNINSIVGRSSTRTSIGTDSRSVDVQCRFAS